MHGLTYLHQSAQERIHENEQEKYSQVDGGNQKEEQTLARLAVIELSQSRYQDREYERHVGIAR